jgi:octanoyl-[GcvH]:protein N-octanoyltransferase
MKLMCGPLGQEQALEMAFAHALVRGANAGEFDEVLRLYQPLAHAVVFSRRDTNAPRFAQAVAAAQRSGFQIAVRSVGGRAVAYTTKALVIDHVRREPQAVAGQQTRFERFAALYAGTLHGLGIAAVIGAVPGEYCPGAYSVNVRGCKKVAGTAQRVLRNAWLFSTLIVLGDENRLQPVLREVYDLLDQPFDECSVGSVGTEAAGLRATDLIDALVQSYTGGRTESFDHETTLNLAHKLLPGHVVTPGGTRSTAGQGIPGGTPESAWLSATLPEPVSETGLSAAVAPRREGQARPWF